jgi:putative acid phosphatase of HAD superfamily subfamily IIIB
MLGSFAFAEDNSAAASSTISVIRGATLRLLFALLISTCAHANSPDCLPKASFPPPEFEQPVNISGLKDQLAYYKCSGAYEREFKRVIDEAISYVQQRAKRGGQLALVLDIDETSLSNWEEMKVNDFGLIQGGPCELGDSDGDGWRVPLPNKLCGFGAWVLSADAKPLDTIRLFRAAKENNVAVFFVTGRRELVDKNKNPTTQIRDATEKNLQKAGYANWKPLMLEPASFTGTVQEFKTQKRKEIIAMGYTIIANVGDQYSDLRSDPQVGKADAEQNYKLPNPFYFVP